MNPTAAPTPAVDVVLSGPEWRERAARHAQRVDDLTAAHRRRTADGTPHPVEDFLFTYYRLSPGALRKWGPGHGVVLQDAAELLERRFHRIAAGPGRRTDPGRPDVEVDVPTFLTDRGRIVAFVRSLIARTGDAPAQFGCFGLHEWAMVFQQQDDRRHRSWPLRLGPDGTDRVVEGHRIRCSHFDAFRFFTPPAVPRNELQPTLEGREFNEQPGCLHAGMDLYKWSAKLLPLVPAELVLDCFDLAKQIRELDMRASPYDLQALGYRPVRIETPEGKAEYVEAQRSFTQRSQALRARLLAALPDPAGS